MPNTIFRVRGGGFLAGRFQRGFHGDGLGSVKQIVHDGDTLNVSSANNFPLRLLGIDTPESSFIAPGTDDRFVSTDHQPFVDLLADPLNSALGPVAGLTDVLASHIAAKASAAAAITHHHYAKAAEDQLELLIQADFDALGIDTFFLAFGYEALDGFGRLLAYVHPHEPRTPRSQRRVNYNHRMLESGHAYPYFIFPNVDPFRAKGSPVEAAALATDPATILAAAPALRDACQAVAEARARGAGVFAAARPNPFEPFELRYLARRQLTSRWLIDLSGTERTLYPPHAYAAMPHAEDRLWLPPEFVPLFEASGWRRMQAAGAPS